MEAVRSHGAGEEPRAQAFFVDGSVKFDDFFFVVGGASIAGGVKSAGPPSLGVGIFLCVYASMMTDWTGRPEGSLFVLLFPTLLPVLFCHATLLPLLISTGLEILEEGRYNAICYRFLSITSSVKDSNEGWLSKLLVRRIEPTKESHSRLLSDKEVIYELQTHNVKPDSFDKYIQNW
uniref:Uncharacterized protein n=1 Tax=Timema genevievae TaxID=629358 RepID=A0A7R9K1M2_TIMGE|nr:unnamed protein product [Timema genevievae]